MKLAEPQFEGQTKTKLGNSEARGFVQRVVTDYLGDWLERNPAASKSIIAKAQSAATARMAARKARENARRKSPLETFGMPGKLADCSSKDPSESEIYLVEGDSISGSAKRGRNPAPRRSFRCAARSSTWSGPVWTRHWATRRSSR